MLPRPRVDGGQDGGGGAVYLEEKWRLEAEAVAIVKDQRQLEVEETRATSLALGHIF
jgi:hypothetical protein